jgi:HlyD family secretion protein
MDDLAKRPADDRVVVVSPMDRRVAAAPRRHRRIALAGAVLVLLGIAVAAYVHFGLTRTVVMRADQLVISTVQQAVFAEYVPATASVAPRTTAYLDAIEGGQVAEKLVEEGAFVTRGQPLVRLKNTDLQLDVLGKQAQLMEQLDRLNSTILSFQQARLGHERELTDARAQVEQFSQRLHRRQALKGSGAVSQSDIDELAIEFDRYRRQQETMTEALNVDERFQSHEVQQLKDAIRTTQQYLAMAGETLQNLVIRAPISGQLTALDAELGAAKTPGQRIGQIDDYRSYKAEAPVDEFYVGRVIVGQSATAELEGRSYRLEVAKVYPQVRERQFKVDLNFAEAPPQSLRHGQTLQVRLEIGAAQRGLVTANGPFYEDAGGTWVFVLGRSGAAAERRAVRLGRRNPEQIEVLAGLAPGERIITSSYETLRAFDRIQIASSEH